MSAPNSEPTQPTIEDAVRSLTPDCKIALGNLLLKPSPEAVSTEIRYMPLGSRVALETLGVIEVTDSDVAKQHTITDFGWRVAFAAATTPPFSETA